MGEIGYIFIRLLYEILQFWLYLRVIDTLVKHRFMLVDEFGDGELYIWNGITTCFDECGDDFI